MTEDEAEKAVSYLVHAFGGYPPPALQRRAYLRLFVTLETGEVRQAIDRLVRSGKHSERPTPADMATAVQTLRREAEQAPQPVAAIGEDKDITTDPEEHLWRVAELKERLRGNL